MKNYKEKICLECGKTFKPNSSTQKYCKECGILKNKNYFKNKEKYQQKHKEWLKKNKEQQKEFRHKNYYNNHERELKRNKQYYNENLEYFKNKGIKYRQLNKDKIKEYKRNKYKNDISFKIAEKLRNYIRRCLNSKKDKHTFEILGYTPLQLKQRLEFQFKNGMNWDNYGTLWHIDHKKPLSLFNFTLPKGDVDYKQIRLANSLCNLQPMLAEENLSKGNRFIL